MLEFEKISLEKKRLFDKYFYRYGEGSCQHSFVSSYCRNKKYGDMFCERGKYLYILRSNLCTEKERIYLFPMGDTSDIQKIKKAIEEILKDAHEYGTTVQFETVTKKAKDLILNLFPDRFKAEYRRDLSEYLYSFNKLANLPGKKLKQKRYDAKRFTQKYEGQYDIQKISSKHIESIRKFQKYWIEEKMGGIENTELKIENDAVNIGLDNFELLNLSGIVAFINGELKGYTCGVAITPLVYDAIFEKGDINIPNIYRILNRDTVRLCCEKFKYINREEDLGIEGLRKSKLFYQPDIILEKYIVTELI